MTQGGGQPDRFNENNGQGGQPLMQGGVVPRQLKPMPWCPESDVDVSESLGMVIMILNIITIGFGTLISSCLDRKGCNCTAFAVSIGQSVTFPLCFYGWYWSIMHGIAVKENSIGKQ